MFRITRKSIALSALLVGAMLPAAAESMAANRIDLINKDNTWSMFFTLFK